LQRAKALLREVDQFLHDLPDRNHPADLAERVRLFLHRDDAHSNLQGSPTP
jgi:hypothetical protein